MVLEASTVPTYVIASTLSDVCAFITFTATADGFTTCLLRSFLPPEHPASSRDDTIAMNKNADLFISMSVFFCPAAYIAAHNLVFHILESVFPLIFYPEHQGIGISLRIAADRD